MLVMPRYSSFFYLILFFFFVLLCTSIIIIYYKTLSVFFFFNCFLKSVFAPKELRKILASLLYNVKQLKLKVDHRLRCYDIIELVDALLWISPLLEIIFIEWRMDDNISFVLQSSGGSRMFTHGTFFYE